MANRLSGEVMNRMVIGSVCAFGLLLATSAFAFETQRDGKTTTPTAGPKTGYGETTTPAPKTEQGTVVRIPGFGKLGVIPRLDFGLELLYGAAKTQPETAPQGTPEPENGDLRIRGSVKHRF